MDSEYEEDLKDMQTEKIKSEWGICSKELKRLTSAVISRAENVEELEEINISEQHVSNDLEESIREIAEQLTADAQELLETAEMFEAMKKELNEREGRGEE